MTEKSVLSLFSGCGGLDLGFEGNFDVLKESVNEKINPDWKCIQSTNKKMIKLSKTRFKTVFANDIREDSKSAWVNYFSKRGIDSSIYRLDSIVDLVKAQNRKPPQKKAKLLLKKLKSAFSYQFSGNIVISTRLLAAIP